MLIQKCIHSTKQTDQSPSFSKQYYIQVWAAKVFCIIEQPTVTAPFTSCSVPLNDAYTMQSSLTELIFKQLHNGQQ